VHLLSHRLIQAADDGRCLGGALKAPCRPPIIQFRTGAISRKAPSGPVLLRRRCCRLGRSLRGDERDRLDLYQLGPVAEHGDREQRAGGVMIAECGVDYLPGGDQAAVVS
jgi:hypothetical protein